MTKTLTEAMKTSISDIMETMFYLPVEFKEGPLPYSPEERKTAMGCRIDFSGDFSGAIILVAPKDLLGEMAENLMGTSPDQLEEQHLAGTLTETLNMICGNTLSRTETENPFSIEVPKIIELSDLSGIKNFIIVETLQSVMAVHSTIH